MRGSQMTCGLVFCAHFEPHTCPTSFDVLQSNNSFGTNIHGEYDLS